MPDLAYRDCKSANAWKGALSYPYLGKNLKASQPMLFLIPQNLLFSPPSLRIRLQKCLETPLALEISMLFQAALNTLQCWTEYFPMLFRFQIVLICIGCKIPSQTTWVLRIPKFNISWLVGDFESRISGNHTLEATENKSMGSKRMIHKHPFVPILRELLNAPVLLIYLGFRLFWNIYG